MLLDGGRELPRPCCHHVAIAISISRESAFGFKPPVTLGPKCAGRAIIASSTPSVKQASLTTITGVRFIHDKIDESLTPQHFREPPRRRFVDPHQRRVQDKPTLHSKIERDLESLDRVVSAIRISGIIGFTHAGDDIAEATTVSQGCGKGQEDQIAARHERVWQPAFAHLDGCIPRQRRVGNLTERGQTNRVFLSEAPGPGRVLFAHALADLTAAFQLHTMTLTVVKANGLDRGKPLQRPSQAGGRILASREKH